MTGAAVTYALHEAVEAFPSTDGSIYFLRGGRDAEQVLEDPSPSERAVLEMLHEPCTLDRLCAGAAAPADDVEGMLASLRDAGLVREDAGAPPDLPEEAAARYDRQLLYFETEAPGRAEEAQRRLLDATVVIIGCGGLGSWTAAGLACAGVGRLVLVDDDAVELSNLNRQLLFRHADLGAGKVEAAAGSLRAFDPGMAVEPIARRIMSAGDVASVAEGADLIVATADTPPYDIARWINEGAMRLRIPHISAGQAPPFVRVGPLVVPGRTACVACQELAAAREYPDYAALVAYRQRRTTRAATLGSLSGLVGSILATDAIHLITGVATPATLGQAIVIDSRDLSTAKEPLEREPGCEVCRSAA